MQFRELFLNQSHLAIVMEFAAGGDMFDYVIKNKGSGGTPAFSLHCQQLKEFRRQALMGTHVPVGPGEGLPETLARRFFQQLIFALDFCQRQGIANRSVHMSFLLGTWTAITWDTWHCMAGAKVNAGTSQMQGY